MRLIGCVTAQHGRRQSSVEAGALSIGLALSVLLTWTAPAAADTPQQTCDKLAGDPVPLERVDSAGAVPACAAAVQAAPGMPRLEYEYGRALEKFGSIDAAKQMYQWASDDGFAPATMALARIKGGPSSPTTNESESHRQIALQLDALADVASRIAKTAPRDHDDPTAALALAGLDPAAILNWVQTNTRLIAYAGTLRGSSGVLMDRAGNSLDRSLLLADLLKRAGNEVRIARAQLDAPVAAGLRAQVQASTPGPRLPSSLDRSELLKAVNDSQLDRSLVEKVVDQTIADNERFQASVKDLYGKVYPALMAAIGNDPKRDQQIAADAEAALRDHFWVQRRVASGWDDLDPDAELVHKLTPATTFAADQVPDDLKHRVTLRVIVETWSAGNLSEAKLLERSWMPSELTGQTILLTHSLFPASPIDQLAQQPDAQKKYIEDLAKAWVLEPILRVGNETITDKLYTLRGETLPAGKGTLARLGVGGSALNVQSLNQVLGAFGDTAAAAKSKPPDEATAPIKVTAEWLEFQIDVPGRASERHRRAVFDSIGPAARSRGLQQPPVIDQNARTSRALALAGATDFLIFGASPDPSSIQRLAGEQLASFIKQVAEGERSSNGSIADIASHRPSGRLQPTLWGWAMNRFVASAPAANPIAPNVALFWHSASVDPGGAMKQMATFDIVANAVEAAGSFRNRVAQGVADTVVERAILGDSALGVNPAYLYAQDLPLGRRWKTLAPGDQTQVDHLGFARDAQALITDDLARGSVVVARDLSGASGSGQRAAWWRIDPHSGVTLGMGQDGRGPEAEEEAAEEFVIDQGICLAFAVANVIRTSIAGKEPSGEALGMYVLCFALGAAGWGANGTGLGRGLGFIDWVLRGFEVLELTAGPHGGHGE
jgi:hypothetical protein